MRVDTWYRCFVEGDAYFDVDVETGKAVLKAWETNSVTVMRVTDIDGAPLFFKPCKLTFIGYSDPVNRGLYSTRIKALTDDELEAQDDQWRA